MQTADLEIGIFPRDAESYMVELRFDDPLDEATRAPVIGTARFDHAALKSLLLNPVGYGALLGEQLLAEEELRTFYRLCRSNAEGHNLPLRLRLAIDPGAAALFELRWETLREPSSKESLVTSENVIFSRFLGSSNWERVSLRSRGDLTGLIFISNPSDLKDGSYTVADQTLAPVDVAGELTRAQTALEGITPAVIASDPQSPGAASLKNLLVALRRGVDVVYIVAHGALLSRPPAGPYLWLEKEDGVADVIPGSLLVDSIRDLPQMLRPRLVVLASCQSSGVGGESRSSDPLGALSALGPMLTRAGIPAVIAMQGEVSMASIEDYMPVFFRELLTDGEIDRAAAAARSAIRQRPDFFMPVLYMRLRSGRLWFEPGFSDRQVAFEKWPGILRSIRKQQCTPILGPGLYESLLGSPREIARRWAEQYKYPLNPNDRDSMPQVAQFLQVNQRYDQAPLDELEEYGIGALRKTYGELIPKELRQGPATLDDLISAAGAVYRKERPHDPYRVLASLPLPIYITTNYNNLLENALAENDPPKKPEVLLCPWNESVEEFETVYDREPGFYPSVDRPIVYHLFGRLTEPDSVVLTEDDYFDFLIGVTRNQDLIPEAVRRALADTALLFLGFQIDDWQFRVLLRSILSQQGGKRRNRYPHISAQIEPEEGSILEPERARNYLESYFSSNAEISLYWGGVEDFVKELNRQWSLQPA